MIRVLLLEFQCIRRTAHYSLRCSEPLCSCNLQPASWLYIMPSWNLLSKSPVPINNSSTCGTCAETHVDWVGRQTLKIPSCNPKKTGTATVPATNLFQQATLVVVPPQKQISSVPLFLWLDGEVEKFTTRLENTWKHPHNLTCQKSILYQVMHWLVKNNRLYMIYLYYMYSNYRKV